MTTKLTLSINEETVKKAKRISRKRGKSISKMVEEFLNSVSEKEAEKKEPEDALAKIKQIMQGKISDPHVDWKKVKMEHLRKKYGF